MGSMEKVVSCEVAFLPIGEGNCAGEVDEVLGMIRKSGLEHSIGPMSTFLRGDREALWNLLSGIDSAMADRCRFVMDIRFSNVCGCG